MVGMKEILQLTIFSSSQNAASQGANSSGSAEYPTCNPFCAQFAKPDPEALNPKPTAFVAERKGAPPSSRP